jgi:hypothetical protein
MANVHLHIDDNLFGGMLSDGTASKFMYFGHQFLYRFELLVFSDEVDSYATS